MGSGGGGSLGISLGLVGGRDGGHWYVLVLVSALGWSQPRARVPPLLFLRDSLG